MKEFCYTIKNAVGVHADQQEHWQEWQKNMTAPLPFKKMAKMAQLSTSKSCLPS